MLAFARRALGPLDGCALDKTMTMVQLSTIFVIILFVFCENGLAKIVGVAETEGEVEEVETSEIRMPGVTVQQVGTNVGL